MGREGATAGELPPAKRVRKAKEAEDEEEEEVEVEVEPEAPKVRKGRVATPEELEPGAVVLYWGEWRGIIHDSFEALDSYWVADEESGEVVRDDGGEILAFKSRELRLVAPPPKLEGTNPYAPAVGVFILGTSTQMMRVLEHFGPPDPAKRTEPQELLAIPCSLCDPGSLLRTARDGVNAVTLKLAQEQRPDLHVALRAYHLRSAVEQCSSLLRLEDYFCLAGVSVPYSQEEIKEGRDKDERRWRKSMANQLDVCVTAYGLKEGEETTQLEATQHALGKSCGMCLSDVLWQEAAQACIRKSLGVAELPLHFVDSFGATVRVVLLPEDASITEEDGIISFHEAFGSDYANLGLEAAEAEEVVAKGSPEKAEKPAAAEADGSPAASPTGGSQSDKPTEKTVSQWEAEQAKFNDQPKLPPGWIRIISRKTGKTYFYNTETQESSFEFPLPEGWTKQVSKSTGKTYWFNARKKLSTFTRPTE